MKKKKVQGSFFKNTFNVFDYSEKVSSLRDYYQVLIHKPDWPHMMFPVDLTCYLQDGSTRGEKYFAYIKQVFLCFQFWKTFSGMDCVSHMDILPYFTNELEPVDHDLFPKIFTRENDDSSGFFCCFNRFRLFSRPNSYETSIT